MIGSAPPNLIGRRKQASLAGDRLTHVELTWTGKRTEHWIRFGRVAHDRIVGRRCRIVSFRPGEVFALIRRASNLFGKIQSRLDIVRTVASGDAYSTLPFVRPGGDLLLSIHGSSKVERVLRAIDGVEAAGVDPCDAAPDHWCHVHNRLTAGIEPRVYSIDRHRAWVQRRELQA